MELTQLLKSLVLGACTAFGFVSATQASPWTITFSGLADGANHYDVGYTNYTNLTGEAYSITVTLDPQTYQYNYSSSSSSFDIISLYGTLTTTATITYSIGSFSKSYSLDVSQSNWGNLLLLNPYDNSNDSRTVLNEEGYTSAGQYVNLSTYVSSYVNAVNAGAVLGQTFSYTTQPGEDLVNVELVSYGTDGSIFIYGSTSPVTITINGSSEVPEPMSMSLMTLGLLGAMTVRRKKRPD